MTQQSLPLEAAPVLYIDTGPFSAAHAKDATGKIGIGETDQSVDV